MNAKMRIGHFTKTQPLRLRVKMVGLKTAFISGFIAFGIAQSLASSFPHYDTNLERWAKERLIKRIGDIRDSYQFNETMRMVTEIDIERGPMPLSAERTSDPVWQISNLNFGLMPKTVLPVPVIAQSEIEPPYPPRNQYAGALIRAGN